MREPDQYLYYRDGRWLTDWDPERDPSRSNEILTNLEQLLAEVLLVKLSEFSETKFTKVREEDSPFLLHLTLHVDHLLLRGWQPQGLHGVQQILGKEKIFRVWK